ncbi:MAG: hypothetical protein MJ209_03110 [archaeon]|nr:hypothetical protein [archaeon]
MIIKLTFDNLTFYNNATLTLKEAIVVNNSTEFNKEVNTTLNTGNPIIVLLIILFTIPLFKRKFFKD